MVKAWRGWEGGWKKYVPWLARSLKHLEAIPGQRQIVPLKAIKSFSELFTARVIHLPFPARGAAGPPRVPAAELAHAAAISWAKRCGAGRPTGLEDFTLRDGPAEAFPPSPSEAFLRKHSGAELLRLAVL